MRRELDGISDKRDEQYKLAREAWDNLKNELIKAVKMREMVNWLERNLRKIKWLR